MIYVLKPTLAQQPWLRLLGILGFAVLTAITAKLTLWREPVPFTLQVLTVLLAGLTLGPRDAFASMLLYLGGIAAGLPIDARGIGLAALTGPTAGYLYAFPWAAGLVGLLALRDKLWVRLAASLLGVAVIYLLGTAHLKVSLDYSWAQAWAAGVAPFLLFDLAKAITAALLGEGLRQWWQRSLEAPRF